LPASRIPICALEASTCHVSHPNSHPNSNQTMSDQAIPNLHFVSLNPTGSQTLLLLHGTFAAHHAFQLLLSKQRLDEYHIIIPDLPYHGLSARIDVPFTLPEISAVLANTISTSAKNGKADLIGDDIGGYIALYLASKYPELVSSVFATGCERDYSSAVYSTWMSIKTYFGAILGMALIPRSWLSSLLVRLDMDFNEHLLDDMRRTISWPYCYPLFQTLHRDWGTG
jgi:pimeloyl-ACP methyl ester carboxylesterase